MSIRYLFFALVLLLPEASIAQTAISTEDDQPVMTSLVPATSAEARLAGAAAAE
jgi:hypothetical protein